MKLKRGAYTNKILGKAGPVVFIYRFRIALFNTIVADVILAILVPEEEISFFIGFQVKCRVDFVNCYT